VRIDLHNVSERRLAVTFMDALQIGSAVRSTRMTRAPQRMTLPDRYMRAFDDLINEADGILYQVERTWSTFFTPPFYKGKHVGNECMI
jgi:hypothetical protein